MKNTNFIVRVPEPCHEDWNKMTPDDKGRFCSSCGKSVIDFSNKSDTEIRDILVENSNDKVCGHFRKSQIDRPLNITVDLRNLPKNMSITKMFAVALFLAFGTLLFSCTDLKGQKIDAFEITKTIGQNNTVGEVENPIEANELLKGKTRMEPDSLMEDMVDGGVRYQEEVIKGDSIVEDTLIQIPQEPIFMRGAVCVVYHPEPLVPEVQNADSILSREVIEKVDVIINKESELSVYPNPANGEFTVKYDVTKRADVRVDVYDMNGMLLKNIVNVSQQYEGRYNIPVNLTELPDGTYFVSIINNGKRFTEKLIIAR